MTRGNISFGSHTMTHPIFADLPEPDLAWELSESKKLISKKIDRPVPFFSLPIPTAKKRTLRFQKKALEKALSVARNLGQYTVTNRIRAILAIAEGKDIGEIASILRVNPATIRQWFTNYLTGGLNALRTVHKQSGRLSRLTKTQKRQLKQWITDGPQGVGFPGACWRSPMIQELICQKFGVFYSVKYISQLLKNLGFSYQKARFSVGGKDPDNQRKREDWLNKTWSEIQNQADKENAYLLFR